MDDLLSEFLTETNEGLALLDVGLVKLERNPNDGELPSNIFRLMRTIKRTCGLLGLPRLESAAHAGENVLDIHRLLDYGRPDAASGRDPRRKRFCGGWTRPRPNARDAKGMTPELEDEDMPDCR